MRIPLFLKQALDDVAGPIVSPIIGKNRTSLWTTDFDDYGPYTFPDDFCWGTAISAHQAEHRQPSDWTAFELAAINEGRTGTGNTPGHGKPGHIHNLDKYSEEVRVKKTNFDSTFKDDLGLAKQMNNNAFRFTLDWSRLFPEEDMEEPDPAGIEYYKNLLEEMIELELTPFATLFSYASPQWFWKERDGKCGWERKDALAHFERYTRAVVKNFGSYIENWCTLNEPVLYLFSGYIEGTFPPLENRKDALALSQATETLLKAHALAYIIIKNDGMSRGLSPMIGVSKHSRAFEPWRNWAPLDRITARSVDQVFTWDFLEAIYTGVFKISNTRHSVKIPGLRGTMDYVGVNYYGRYYVESNLLDPSNPRIHLHDPNDPMEETSDLGWASYPHGFYNVLVETHKRFDLPIMVLENGIADMEIDDEKRQRFLVSHIKELWNAMKYGGVDIRAYFHWSLMDNFQWDEGFEAQFGLYKTDYNNNFERIPRKSAEIFSQIISMGITQELWENYSQK